MYLVGKIFVSLHAICLFMSYCICTIPWERCTPRAENRNKNHINAL